MLRLFAILSSTFKYDLLNYFDDLIKLLSDLYLNKFLDTLAKPFFALLITSIGYNSDQLWDKLFY